MNLDQFWKIIESTRVEFDPRIADGNMQRQLEQLRGRLSRLPPEEILAFRHHLFDRMDAAFQWDLWGAAYLLANGCSEDGFADFRSWLISMGRRVFEAALLDPDSLVDVVDSPGVEDFFFEEFQYVPAQVYERVTGREPPPVERHPGMSPRGTAWSREHPEALSRSLPRLWASRHAG